MTTCWARAEYLGGPYDGRRVILQHPFPMIIHVHFRPFPAGTYRQRPNQNFHVVYVDETYLQTQEGKDFMKTAFAGLARLEYDWEGYV